jgi:hypothetical protein
MARSRGLTEKTLQDMPTQHTYNAFILTNDEGKVVKKDERQERCQTCQHNRLATSLLKSIATSQYDKKVVVMPTT